MAATSDMQQMTDVEQAKAKLQEVAETKEGMKDPRASEKTGITKRDLQPRDIQKETEGGDVRRGHWKWVRQRLYILQDLCALGQAGGQRDGKHGH